MLYGLGIGIKMYIMKIATVIKYKLQDKTSIIYLHMTVTGSWAINNNTKKVEQYEHIMDEYATHG